MDYPSRKPNRLKDYDYSQNGAYFITICTEGRQRLLGSIYADAGALVPRVGDDAHIVPPSPGAEVHLSEYGAVVNKYLLRITGVDKYVIMPNHVHMIVHLQQEDPSPVGDGAHIVPPIRNPSSPNGTMWASSPTVSVPQLVRSFKTLVTKETGHKLWQRSYHDHIIRSQQEYLEIWRYIDENPIKWADDCYFEQ